jgi:hypothetical protein
MGTLNLKSVQPFGSLDILTLEAIWIMNADTFLTEKADEQ